MHSNKANHVCMAMMDILKLNFQVLKMYIPGTRIFLFSSLNRAGTGERTAYSGRPAFRLC